MGKQQRDVGVHDAFDNDFHKSGAPTETGLFGNALIDVECWQSENPT